MASLLLLVVLIGCISCNDSGDILPTETPTSTPTSILLQSNVQIIYIFYDGKVPYKESDEYVAIQNLGSVSQNISIKEEKKEIQPSQKENKKIQPITSQSDDDQWTSF